MDIGHMIEIAKALSNETRVNILRWLKDPEANFPPQGCPLPPGYDWRGGVCVGSICTKAQLSQSAISNYLATLSRVGLVTTERVGKWTYVRRNEEAIEAYAEAVRTEL